MAALPLEIVDKIMTSNPNKIISNYMAYVRKNQQVSSSSQNNNTTENLNKRRRIDSQDKNKNKHEHNGVNIVSKHLLSLASKMRYYMLSSWLKYFTPSSPGGQSRLKQKLSKIDSIIEIVANYFNLLDSNSNSNSHCHQPSAGLSSNANANVSSLDLNLISKFETILETGAFSQEGFDKYLVALEKYYGLSSIYEIPAFVRLVIILYESGYFVSSNSHLHNDSSSASSASDAGASSRNTGLSSKVKLHIFLELLLESGSSKIDDFIRTYTYYASTNKFIPLFDVYLEMGYSFVIGWDTVLDGLIGFMENGSDGYEVMYNIHKANGYFSRPIRSKGFKKNKTGSQNGYGYMDECMKMLGCRDISILMDYARRLNIVDMHQ
jgi:hypothetical protein